MVVHVCCCDSCDILRSSDSVNLDSRLRIESVYGPAQEVDGDFFHIAQIDGLSRVVVGDVSGKASAPPYRSPQSLARSTPTAKSPQCSR
jgi:serine phosphatase RsbU (regulator of sigma subunit)